MGITFANFIASGTSSCSRDIFTRIVNYMYILLVTVLRASYLFHPDLYFVLNEMT